MVQLVFLILSQFQFLQASQTENPLQAQARLVPSQIEPGQVVTLEVDLNLPKNYRAYADQFKLRVLSNGVFLIGKIQISPLEKFYDENTKKEKLGVIGQAKITAPFEFPKRFPNDTTLILGLTYQACTSTYCLFPIEIELPVTFSLLKNLEEKSLLQEWGIDKLTSMNFKDVLNLGLFWTFLFVFLGGVLTSFTPCIFPMIPITLTVLGKEAHLRSKRKQILVSHIYVLGIAFTYSMLGIFAASTGALFGSMMNSPWVLSAICFIYFLMALSLFGLFEVEAPLKVQHYLTRHFKTSGLSGVFIQGILAGVVASPCVGPILVGILTYVAQSQNIFFGFSLLFVFALGMGQLFLLFGFSSQLIKLLPKSGAWMEGIKKIFAIILMIPFYYFLNLIVSPLVFNLSLGIGFMVLAAALGLFKITKLKTTISKLIFSFNLILFLTGFSIIAFQVFYGKVLEFQKPTFQDGLNSEINQTQILDPQIQKQWKDYSQALFNEAKLSKKPILIDFWADWCAACKELESKTFTSPEFKSLAQEFLLLKFDATKESSELDELRKKYNIVGLPTVVFINPQGQWLEDLTVNEFIEGPQFAERMKKALDNKTK